jgi:hypothetical protein
MGRYVHVPQMTGVRPQGPSCALCVSDTAVAQALEPRECSGPGPLRSSGPPCGIGTPESLSCLPSLPVHTRKFRKVWKQSTTTDRWEGTVCKRKHSSQGQCELRPLAAVLAVGRGGAGLGLRGGASCRACRVPAGAERWSLYELAQRLVRPTVRLHCAAFLSPGRPAPSQNGELGLKLHAFVFSLPNGFRIHIF